MIPVAWGSSKQAIQADSSAASELVGVHTAVRETLTIAQAMGEMPLRVCVDNAAVIRIAKRGESTQLGLYTVKPLRIRVGLLRDLVDLRVVEIAYVNTALNKADCSTKLLERCKLEAAQHLIGLV